MISDLLKIFLYKVFPYFSLISCTQTALCLNDHRGYRSIHWILQRLFPCTPHSHPLNDYEYFQFKIYLSYAIVRLSFEPIREVPRSPIRPLEVLTARTGSPTSYPDSVRVPRNLQQKIIFLFRMDGSQISLKKRMIDLTNNPIILQPSQTDSVLLPHPT